MKRPGSIDLGEILGHVLAEADRRAKLPDHTLVKPEKDPTGRNEPCPCGSGQKYKKCCLK